MFVRNAWYAILDESELPGRGKLLTVKRFATDLVVWRGPDGIAVQEDRCPHKGAPLSRGKICNRRLRCAFHGMEFAADGTCRFVPQFEDQRRIPKNFGVKTYLCRVEHGLLWLWWGDDDAVTDLPFFSEVAGQRVMPAVWCDVQASFVRVMESHFDLYHTDSLHRWPLRLGRINKSSQTVTEGARIRCDTLFEDRKGGAQHRVRATVLFPGMSLYELGDEYTMAIMVVTTTCPIDERSSWYHMRQFSSWFKIPVFGRLLNGVNNLITRLKVLPEDVDMWARQRPTASGLKSDRLIVPADRGIVEYWRMLRHAQGLDVDSAQQHLDVVS